MGFEEPEPNAKTIVGKQVSEMKVPHWVPTGADVAIESNDEHSSRGYVVLDGKRLVRLIWSHDGSIRHEQPLDDEGQAHGVEMERGDDGRIAWCAHWVHGLMHGPAMQLDEGGLPLFITEFKKGCGVDIWMCGTQLAEFREMAEGVPHGVVRWGVATKPHEEEYFFHGRRHGIFRQWNEDGRLRDGFPKFYLHDSGVDKVEYDRAREADSALPAYSPTDDANQRTVPPALKLALLRAQQFRDELAIVQRAAESLANPSDAT